MEYILLILGCFIIIITYYDFFVSTLPGNGFGILSRGINKTLTKLILIYPNRTMRNNSGFIHLLMNLFFWVFLLFSGSFIIFISADNMVISSQAKIPASIVERLYYTGYVLSTLGMGDYIPGNDFSRIASSLLSFSGFILLTTSMTYLVSVMNAVNHKRDFAKFISTIGSDPGKLFSRFTSNDDLTVLTDKAGELQQMILSHANHHLSFPIVHHFLAVEKSRSVAIQVSSLYETLRILSIVCKDDTAVMANIFTLRNAIEDFLEVSVIDITEGEYDHEEISKQRKYWEKFGLKEYANKESTFTYDKKINTLLKSSGWDWKDLYPDDNNK